MSDKNARRRCRGAFWMQRALCGIAIGSSTFLAFSPNALATRGRVKIANNTVVTDRDTLIRGGRVSLDIWDETPSQSDVDTMKNNRGLNAFHIYAEYAGSNRSPGYNVDKVDHVVDMADDNDLYVVLTIGCGGDNGSFNQNFVTGFWDFYAPRYKDRTHVVYELMNEPQAWSAPYNNSTLSMEKNGYEQIRGLAPDTHIMMMSYSQPNNWDAAANECEGLGIDWSNASVAFHTYGIDGREDRTLTSFFNALQGKGIAYTCTEPNLTLQVITTQLFERDEISQTYFISAHEIATNDSSFANWITGNNICWTPDFGTWPCGSGGVPGTGGAPTGGAPTGGANTGGIPTGGTTTGGAVTGGVSSAGGSPAIGGAPASGGAVAAGGTSDAGGAMTAGGTSTAVGSALSAGGSVAPPASFGPSGSGDDSGCTCSAPSSRSLQGGAWSLLLGLGLVARRRRMKRLPPS